MRESLLAHLACPVCRSESLELEPTKRAGSEIEEGRILCAGCSLSYPVVRGVPRMLPERGGISAETDRSNRTSSPVPCA